MTDEEMQKTMDQYPKIGEPYPDDYVGIPDIWRCSYCGDIHEGIDEGYCPAEEADGVKTDPCPPLTLSEWPWVIAAYAIVVVPFVAAVVGISFWARQSLDRFAIIAISSFVVIFVGVPATLATWDWIKEKAPWHKRANQPEVSSQIIHS